MNETLNSNTKQTSDITGWDKLGEQEKPVGELSLQEAAEEYLGLLLELSKGFESAEGKTSRVAEYDKNGNIVLHPSNSGYSDPKTRIVAKLWETRTGDKFDSSVYTRSGEIDSDGVSHFKDPYIDRELSIDLADQIISAESDWRAAGEETTIENENKLHARNKRKGFFSVLRNKNNNPHTPAEDKTFNANYRLQRALEAAYSKDYGYGHHSLSYEHSKSPEYQSKTNEEYNQKFFSPQNAPTIDRAIELRRRIFDKQ